ncbi:MAG: right-handed parallel beta-helix repeat-containing protein [Pirellulales bacterium]|nr:right-handed parallel beta-helix repeat-containing protein [Pirellulales bacterium]
MCIRLRWLVFALVLVGVGPAAARDYYVNNVAGDDGFDGSAERASGGGTGPVRSINRALALAYKGDRVRLTATGQPYRESLALVGHKHSGNGFTPFVLDGRGAVLDGSVEVPLMAWEHFRDDVYRFRPRRQAYQQLFRDQLPLVRRELTADGIPPELQPLEWCLFDGYVYLRVEAEKLVRDYHLTHAGLQTGITLYHAHDIILANITVQGFHLDGINANDVVGETVLAGITCRGNGRAGLTVAGASHVQVLDCVLGDNGRAQLYCEGPAVATVARCDLIGNTAPPIVQRSGEVYLDGKLVEDAAKAPRRW